MGKSNRKHWWFAFEPTRWLSDSELRRCSKRARATWVDLLCLMHDCQEPGVLATNGKPWTDEDIIGALPGSPDENREDLDELISKGVASRNEAGAIICRMMVDRGKLSAVRRESGAAGGNPKLKGKYNSPGFAYAIRRQSDNFCKCGISTNPRARMAKIAANHPRDVLTLVAEIPVKDMGAAEQFIHKTFAHKQVGASEWFRLTDADISSLSTLHMQNDSNNDKVCESKPLIVDVVIDSSLNKKGVQGETEAPHPPDINALVPDDLLALCSEWKGRSLGSTQMCELAERVQKHGAALVEKAIRLHLANGNALGNWKYLDKVIEGGARERKAGSLDGIDWKKVFA